LHERVAAVSDHGLIRFQTRTVERRWCRGANVIHLFLREVPWIFIAGSINSVIDLVIGFHEVYSCQWRRAKPWTIAIRQYAGDAEDHSPASNGA